MRVACLAFIFIAILIASCNQRTNLVPLSSECANQSPNESDNYYCFLRKHFGAVWEKYRVASDANENESYRLLSFTSSYIPERIGYSQMFISKDYLRSCYYSIYYYDSVKNGLDYESCSKSYFTYEDAYWPELDTFKVLLERSNFWEMEENCDYCKNVADGYSFFLEGTKDGKTKMVHRMIPDYMAKQVIDSTEASQLMNFYLLCRQLSKLQ